MPKRRRLTLTNNSHSISDFQQCPELYKYTNRLKIEPQGIYPPFVRGQVITNVLAEYYWRKMNKGKLGFTDLEECAAIIEDAENLDDESTAILYARFLSYAKHYRNESWVPRAVEQNKLSSENNGNAGTGFSKILYENERVLFIWEGEPDLVIGLSAGNPRLIVVDHKSESRYNDLYMYTNQFIGYAWALETDTVCINYFNIKSSGDADEWFRRRTITYSKQQIENWKRDTIYWYYKIILARKNRDYPKSWQCDGKYGPCRYHALCEQTHDFIIADKIKREFKPRERKRSW